MRKALDLAAIVLELAHIQSARSFSEFEPSRPCAVHSLPPLQPEPTVRRESSEPVEMAVGQRNDASFSGFSCDGCIFGRAFATSLAFISSHRALFYERGLERRTSRESIDNEGPGRFHRSLGPRSEFRNETPESPK